MEDYSKLRPDKDIERCECSAVSGLLLVYLFTRNPIHCSTCRKEVDPERLGLTTIEVEEIAGYLGIYGALYNLWLDSGEYESLAKEKLIDPKVQVNRTAWQSRGGSRIDGLPIIGGFTTPMTALPISAHRVTRCSINVSDGARANATVVA